MSVDLKRLKDAVHDAGCAFGFTFNYFLLCVIFLSFIIIFLHLSSSVFGRFVSSDLEMIAAMLFCLMASILFTGSAVIVCFWYRSIDTFVVLRRVEDAEISFVPDETGCYSLRINGLKERIRKGDRKV